MSKFSWLRLVSQWKSATFICNLRHFWMLSDFDFTLLICLMQCRRHLRSSMAAESRAELGVWLDGVCSFHQSLSREPGKLIGHVAKELWTALITGEEINFYPWEILNALSQIFLNFSFALLFWEWRTCKFGYLVGKTIFSCFRFPLSLHLMWNTTWLICWRLHLALFFLFDAQMILEMKFISLVNSEEL